jgi:hypothetical protein
METRLRNLWVGTGLLVFIFGGNQAQAVEFKIHNQTSFRFRIRVHDRNEWRAWVEVAPGFWDVVAPKVERKDHDVEIDVYTNKAEGSSPDWIPFHRGRHGSKVFTRVLHLSQPKDGQRPVILTWHDEPPGCRDKPVLEENGQFKNGCLVKSGWGDELLKQVAEKIAPAIYKIVGGA